MQSVPINSQLPGVIGSQNQMPTAVMTAAPVTPVQKKLVAVVSRRAT